MITRASCYFVLVLTRYMIFPATGQSTVTEGCEYGEQNGEAIRHLNEQVQDMRKLLADSFQQLKNAKGQSTTVTEVGLCEYGELNSEAIRHLNEQVQDMRKLLEESFQQLKNAKGQTTVTDGCENGELKGEAIRRLNEQVQNMRKFFNESFQQLKGQQDNVMKSLEVIERRPNESNICFRNQTQNSWKLDIVYEMDVGEVPILLSTVNDWIVYMNRFDGSVNFNRNWTEYKIGFGDIRRGEFWLGNEKVHRLTNRFVYTFRLEMYANGTWYYAEYATFSLESEKNKYAIHLSGFNGNIGDMFISHYGMNFSTSDNDNDRWSTGNCAQAFGGGWWFNNCHVSCLTCPYNSNYRSDDFVRMSIRGSGMQAVRMMMKSK